MKANPMRFLGLLATSAFLAACGTAQEPRAPAITTESARTVIGCVHVAGMIHSPRLPVEEVVRRNATCPPQETWASTGWIGIADEGAFLNYTGIARGFRNIPPPTLAELSQSQ